MQKVLSFEPNPKTLTSLFDNALLNESDIQICAFALFEHVSSMTLYIASGNSGMTTLTPWKEATYSHSVECLTTTGDSLCSGGFDVPNVIKLDTEGSELNVLKGCQKILSSPELELIIFEAANDVLEKGHIDDLTELLKDHGFTRIVKLGRKERTHHALSNFAAYRN